MTILTTKQGNSLKRKCSFEVRNLANKLGFAANFIKSPVRPHHHSGDGYGRLVELVKPATGKVVGAVLCTTLTTSEETRPFYIASDFDGLKMCHTTLQEAAVNFAAGKPTTLPK